MATGRMAFLPLPAFGADRSVSKIPPSKTGASFSLPGCWFFRRLLRGVAQGIGMASEDHRAARAEDFHVQAGIGTAGFPAVPLLRIRLPKPTEHRGRFRPRRPDSGAPPTHLPPREKPPCRETDPRLPIGIQPDQDQKPSGGSSRAKAPCPGECSPII